MWLGAGDPKWLPAELLQRLESDDLMISPIVELELAFLHEIGRLTEGASPLLERLRRSIGLTMDSTPFELVTSQAADERFSFTRDPFDRVIAAQAACSGAALATKDRAMRKYLDFAIWD